MFAIVMKDAAPSDLGPFHGYSTGLPVRPGSARSAHLAAQVADSKELSLQLLCYAELSDKMSVIDSKQGA